MLDDAGSNGEYFFPALSVVCGIPREGRHAYFTTALWAQEPKISPSARDSQKPEKAMISPAATCDGSHKIDIRMAKEAFCMKSL